MSDKELRANREKKIRLERQIEEVTKKHEQEEKVKQELEEGRGLLGDAPEHWHKWALEDKQRLIRLTTEAITLFRLADGWYTLRIEWSPYLGFNFVDTAFIWQRLRLGDAWTEEENQFLRQHYPTSSQGWILEQMPDRTWNGVGAQARALNLKRPHTLPGSELPRYMSMNDWRILEQHGLMAEGPEQRLWWQSSSLVNDVTNA